MQFSLQPFCNAFLEDGNKRVDVIMTVRAVETAGAPRPKDRSNSASSSIVRAR